MAKESGDLMVFGYFGFVLAVIVAFRRAALYNSVERVDFYNGGNRQQVVLVFVAIAV